MAQRTCGRDQKGEEIMSGKPLADQFRDELCDLIEKYSDDGMMSAGDIVGAIDWTKHDLMHRANDMAEDDYNADNEEEEF